MTAMTATPMTQFLAWWVETDRLLEANGLPRLPFVEAREWHECDIEPTLALALVAGNHAWAAERAARKNDEEPEDEEPEPPGSLNTATPCSDARGEEPPYCDHCLADFATKRLGCERLCDTCFEEMVEAQKADYAHDISRE
jgi:hypothetical protein